MAKITICDWRDDKGKPCAERADLLVSFTDSDGKRWELDVCSQLHGKVLTANAREATSEPTATVTRLPRAEPKQQKTGRTAALREWAAEQNPPIKLSKGRQKDEHIAAFEKATGQSYWQ